MRSFLAVCLALVATCSYGQLVYEDEYGQYQPIEIKCQAPESAQILYEYRALDNQKEYSVRSYDGVEAFWGEPGRYAIEATVIVVDFDTREFSVVRHRGEFTITGGAPVPPGPVPPEPGPNPPTPPSPNVPSDDFDNIGQRIDALCSRDGLQYDIRQRIAEVFQTTATRMMDPGGFVRVSDARDYVVKEMNNLNLDNSWQEVRNLIDKDAKDRSKAEGGMSWEEVYLWYRAIAAGFKGGPL